MSLFCGFVLFLLFCWVCWRISRLDSGNGLKLFLKGAWRGICSVIMLKDMADYSLTKEPSYCRGLELGAIATVGVTLILVVTLLIGVFV